MPKLRGSRTHEGLPISDASPISVSNKKRWSTLMPWLIALVVIAQLTFLGRLGIAKNATYFHSWRELLRKQHSSSGVKVAGVRNSGIRGLGGHRYSGLETCEEWLEREDTVVYSRDFNKDPIWISTSDVKEDVKTCAVNCSFRSKWIRKADATFKLHKKSKAPSVHRSMESASYYAENNITQARREGFDIVMTTSLSSDVPVGYFSWAEYDIMAPVIPKSEKALAAAFISNCIACNFRLEALLELEKENIKIDSYGLCHRNREGGVDKVEILKRYKFSLAFENSNEEDYVTEKFFQSLVAGSVPVVIGAPNIEDFAPSSDSYLQIKDLKDVRSIAEQMKYLAGNPDAYNRLLRWKQEGPTDTFKALLDMAAVHSSCRLCIHIATAIWEKEEKDSDAKKRPCKCNKGSETVYHLYVRERGRFEMDSIFLRSGNMTLNTLEAAVHTHFKFRKHVPIWKPERPESLRGGDELKVYRIYPLGLTQRQALYTFKFKGDADFKNHIENNPCAKFEVIFV
ncbi:Glycoprotein 3-alpha-L-fucosyltransferase A -like protein [Gossypium arboreum]|uniref:Fucosyltransferase n=1 Tax=Gossypium arboreum TaxID=29729 RepID=A0A0B0MHW5_GOSAR|nr:Glycoprotein 3-alpha-L-fucosyltransferase A -like protein [Gossypium arboreum]